MGIVWVKLQIPGKRFVQKNGLPDLIDHTSMI